jgi:hypothetical protein
MPVQSTSRLERSIETHAARTAVRRLVADLFDRWDEGDAAGFGEQFLPDGVWHVIPEWEHGDSAGVVERFNTWRTWEPWSCHWVTNEHITSDGVTAHGDWLWLAASSVQSGRLAAWSGGDLAIDAVQTARGWKIRSAQLTARFRCPYREGWLRAPLVPILDDLGTTPHAGAGSPPPLRPGGSFSDDPIAPPNRLAESMMHEQAVRNLMADHLLDMDNRVAGNKISARWVDDGAYLWSGAGTSNREARGRPAIGEAFDWQGRNISAVARFLTSESIVVEEHRATCRWRDLWTAVSDRQSARWMGHRYFVVATWDGTTWRFSQMKQETILDCPYDDGWLRSV